LAVVAVRLLIKAQKQAVLVVAVKTGRVQAALREQPVKATPEAMGAVVQVPEAPAVEAAENQRLVILPALAARA
jgi:hypothetical protein